MFFVLFACRYVTSLDAIRLIVFFAWIGCLASWYINSLRGVMFYNFLAYASNFAVREKFSFGFLSGSILLSANFFCQNFTNELVHFFWYSLYVLLGDACPVQNTKLYEEFQSVETKFWIASNPLFFFLEFHFGVVCQACCCLFV